MAMIMEPGPACGEGRVACEGHASDSKESEAPRETYEQQWSLPSGL